MTSSLDYYRVLSIQHDASDITLKQAYRRAALQTHPLKNKTIDASASSKQAQQFALVTEAYDVLSHPERRAIFDQFGERGLKLGAILDGNTRTTPYKFDASPETMFEEVFGTSSPFTATFAYETNAKLTNSIDKAAEKQQIPSAQEIKLFLSLEEIFDGCTRNVKVTRKSGVTDTSTEEYTFEVKIGRGWKAGTRITFENEGDANAQGVRGDITFIVQDRPHPVYKRAANNDLLYKHSLTLSEALCGSTLTLTTLDSREITVALSTIITPSTRHVVANEGMPKPNSSSRQDLVITFEIIFPEQLSMSQKHDIKRTLLQ